MALTITYDGYGVVANADSEVDDTGGSGTGDWKELGGGTIGLNPDVPYYGVASIGSQYASKSGYSYIDGITALDFTPTTGAQAGEYIYCWINIQSKGVFLTLANNGFSIMIGSSTGDHYMWKIAGKNDANGWSGGWKLFVIDPQLNTGTVQTGTPDLSAVTTIGVWINTDVSVRADSVFQSQIFCAKGLTVTGTPTVTGDGLNEIVAWSTDLTNRAAGMFQKRGNTYYSLGSLTVGDGSTSTTLSTNGNNVEYEESSFWNGSAWISSFPSTANTIVTTANASIANQDTSISGFIDNKLAYDTSLGNTSSFTGGSLKYLRSITVKATDTFSGCVFSLNDALSLGAATYDGCTFNTSGTLTIESTTSFINNTVNSPSGTTGVLAPILTNMIGNTFVSGGAGHAIEITTTGTFTFTDNVFTGYGADDTTDASIYNNSGGLVTINVSGGSGITVRNGSGASTVINNNVNVTFTGMKDNTEVRIYDSGTDVEIAGIEDVVDGTTDNRSFTWSDAAANVVYYVIHSKTYETIRVEGFAVPSTNASIPIQQRFDRNYDNPL